MNPAVTTTTRKGHTFRLVLIKPSHYDDDGYVIQWLRSSIPSNTLAALNGLALDCARRQVLGKDVEILIDIYDETNTVLSINRIIRRIKASTGGMVGLVGVQSNQFPRAVDIANSFLDAKIPVVIGGFHISGCLSMLPEIPPDIQAAMDKGITMFAGEAEDHLDVVLRDAYARTLQPLYNVMSQLPNLEGTPTPYLSAQVVRKTFERTSSFDAGRGCPFQCSFCTIINVQGRQSRFRSADDVEALIRANLKQGVRKFFITDDDFARNKNWEAIMDRCIKMREEEGLRPIFTIQVDTLCHKIPRFIDKCTKAGCRNVFIGLESINPDSLVGAKKRQNHISEYRQMLQAWKDHGCTTVAGYILGFPTDTLDSIARDIAIIKHELPIDLLEFFCLTPLPGSEDHQQLHKQGVWMDPDMNIYDLEHVTTHHPAMSKEEWQQAYTMAWSHYYTLEHVDTILRRAAAKGQSMTAIFNFLLWFYGCSMIERVHPLQGGLFRRKVRHTRRSGVPLEHPLVFYPKRLWEVLSTIVQWTRLFWTFHRIRQRILNDPKKRTFMDLALTPVMDQEEEDLDLMKVFASHIPIASLRRRKTDQVAS